MKVIKYYPYYISELSRLDSGIFNIIERIDAKRKAYEYIKDDYKNHIKKKEVSEEDLK